MRPRLPPVAATRAAVLVLLPVVAVLAVIGPTLGAAGIVWCVLGVVAALPAATLDVPWRDRVLLGGVAIAATVLGMASQGRPVQAALAVAAASFLQAPLGRRSPGIGAMVPVLAAVAASAGLPDQRWSAALSLAAGMATIVATAAVMGLRVSSTPVTAALAWRHAVALALTASLALGVTMQQQVTHGYWLVLTLCLVLRPVADETRTLARDRVVGTVVGLAGGVLAAALLPVAVVLALSAACVLLTAAWGLAGDSRRALTYSAPLLVLLGSSGLAGSGVALALERIGYTVVGVAIAVALAVALDVADRADEDRSR